MIHYRVLKLAITDTCFAEWFGTFSCDEGVAAGKTSRQQRLLNLCAIKNQRRAHLTKRHVNTLKLLRMVAQDSPRSLAITAYGRQLMP
jgi:hypothetical protein